MTTPYIKRVSGDGTDRTSCCDTPSVDPLEGEGFRRCSFCRHPLADAPCACGHSLELHIANSCGGMGPCMCLGFK